VLVQVGPRQFERVLDMVSKVRALGMEVCTTLGMLTKEQAEQLKARALPIARAPSTHHVARIVPHGRGAGLVHKNKFVNRDDWGRRLPG
jgi:hypothetical protein